jgi:signal transduction histidine kinase
VLGRPRGRFGIRLGDVGMAAVVLVAVELSVVTGGGPGAAPLNAEAYLLGAVLVLPVLVRNRYPRFELLACSVLLLLYYTFDRRDISPAPLLSVPLYDAAVAGFLVAAIVIPAVYMAIGLVVVELSNHSGLVALINDFLPSVVVLALAIMLGDTVRSRRALAAETAERLRVAHEEREAEAARRVAEERLRIARDLHDTVAHSMATITVQAGSALHVLGDRDDRLRGALTAIRETSKHALREMRATLGQLRQGTGNGAIQMAPGGLDRLPALRDAVTAAGAPVTIAVEGEQRPLPPSVDEVAYRIVQESLTNVLRHAGPAARATVRLCYEPTTLGITVIDDGAGVSPRADTGPAPAAKERGRGRSGGSGPPGARGCPPEGTVSPRASTHGLIGMAERAASVGGQVTAGPRGTRRSPGPGHPHRPGARGGRAGRRGAVQRGDRGPARGEPAHRQDPRQPGDDQARRPGPGAARGARLHPRPSVPVGLERAVAQLTRTLTRKARIAPHSTVPDCDPEFGGGVGQACRVEVISVVPGRAATNDAPVTPSASSP